MLNSFFGAAQAGEPRPAAMSAAARITGVTRANGFMVQPSWFIRCDRGRGLARTIDANPGDRGLPGFYPAVHPGWHVPRAAALGPATPSRSRNPSHQLFQD